ncbi:MAG: pyridoxal-phosphate dependent enzyme [Bacteroidales bacterium]|jgi:threonine dehydratase|nr:pyridoxal-phosphate dependent enzyme [Bacteroidales bacterium]MDD3700946.1 pyridoxal-phosphate dependent enzyme [Bacteroidales bacterium]MDY0370020.1 pyridoxal-phosphate dependent enzyme [Bacteroidales bacterium]
MLLQHPPGPDDIRQAHKRIAPYVHETPILFSTQLNALAESILYFKSENFQKTGSFKSRGAVNALLSLDPEILRKGVATHSSGNHAQALARAASLLQIPAYIVMPRNAPKVKVAAVEAYGGQIFFCEPTLEAREQTLEKVRFQTGAVEIHPFNNYDVIAGQATANLELLQSISPPDYILCPVGGGGLLSGTLLSTHYFSPATKVIACEPEGANDAWQSFKAGKFIPSSNPVTIADGLLTSLGSLTYPIIMDYVTDIITVNDQAIIQAMKLVWERVKIIIEPSAAVPVAVALQEKQLFRNKRIGIILSGGNIDLQKLPWQ